MDVHAVLMTIIAFSAVIVVFSVCFGLVIRLFLAPVTKDIEHLKTDVSRLETRQIKMEQDIEGLKTGQGKLEQDIEGLKAGQANLGAMLKELLARKS